MKQSKCCKKNKKKKKKKKKNKNKDSTVSINIIKIPIESESLIIIIIITRGVFSKSKYKDADSEWWPYSAVDLEGSCSQ